MMSARFVHDAISFSFVAGQKDEKAEENGEPKVFDHL